MDTCPICKGALNSVEKDWAQKTPKNCSSCVHSFDLGIRFVDPVHCLPQRRFCHPKAICTSFRLITIAEMNERRDAEYGRPGASKSAATTDEVTP